MKSRRLPPTSMDKALDRCSHEDKASSIPPMPKTIAKEIVEATYVPPYMIPEGKLKTVVSAKKYKNKQQVAVPPPASIGKCKVDPPPCATRAL